MKLERSTISKWLLAFFLLIFLFEGISSNGVIAEPIFIPTQEDLIPYYNVENSVLIASPGRSGSTMLLNEIVKHVSLDWITLKAHILPPKKAYRGKIIFIFSNPDKAAESALHQSIHNDAFGVAHFHHLESSDKEWLKTIRFTTHQTEKHNLLAYDALGCSQQLFYWLYCRTTPCECNCAQILAVKYENLWEPASQQAIGEFLALDGFILPPYLARGVKLDHLSEKERLFRTLYNRGTEEEPLYKAYDMARWMWKNTPPVQFLEIN